MKIKNKIMAGAVALAFLTLAAGSLQAQQLINLFTFSASAQFQGGTNDNGKITTLAAPAKHSINTKQLLGLLAQDEFAAGDYPTNTFPAGAVLAVVEINNTNYIQVLNKDYDLLVDVDNILKITHETNDIYSGSFSDTTTLADPSVTDLRILKFFCDDSGIVGAVGVVFELQGVESRTVKDTIPAKQTEDYTETVSIQANGLAGEGTYLGYPFIGTGSISLSGSVVKHY